MVNNNNNDYDIFLGTNALIGHGVDESEEK